ncbi:hypothetical protein P7C73_g2354, partial [Tremellales sp. Uapishka_1]
MVLHNLSISGPSMARVNLMFFSDGCASSPSFFPAEPYDVLGSDTPDEEAKFLSDASALTRDIVSESGPMAHVSHLLNVYAVFVPSNTSGIGTYDQPLPGAAFGLYRPGPELRGVYVQEEKRARAACRYWRGKEGEGAGCDQPILLGNDGLYGGLGGEFTVITASEKNGALVLRHELGHSLIDVGEEYEGGYSYFGANSDKVKSLHSLKWSEFLSDPQGIRIEDVKVPFQAYPWHNLTSSSYTVSFNSTSLDPASYPTARLRTSLSSIPFPSHVNLTLNAKSVDLHPAFPDSWAGSLDRRWIEIPLPAGLPPGENTISVELTQEGREAKEGQGGKMITSLEIAEYGGDGRCVVGFGVGPSPWD